MARGPSWLPPTVDGRDAHALLRLHQWAVTVHDRRGHNKATIAVANKLGRLVWAVWHKDQAFMTAAA